MIIYLDPVLDISAVNNKCNDAFLGEIQPLKEHFKHIYPVTMIGLDFFVEQFYELQKRPSILKELIIAYHKRVMSNLASYHKTGEVIVYFNAQQSFSMFTHDKFKKFKVDLQDIARDMGVDQITDD